jgi:hypothetical protein
VKSAVAAENKRIKFAYRRSLHRNRSFPPDWPYNFRRRFFQTGYFVGLKYFRSGAGWPGRVGDK